MTQKPHQTDETYSKRETEQRRDEALKRALNTPPKPYKKKEPATKDRLQRESKSKS
jgi:hypothetical protein